jgi:nucleoside-diphosphate-sugar epimerase
LFRRSTDDDAGQARWDHLVRNHCFSIEKARTLLGYTPRYEPEDAILESVRWLIDHEQLDVANPLTA